MESMSFVSIFPLLVYHVIKTSCFTESPSEGAVGGSDEVIPKWEDPREEANSDEMHEVRKRRLEHFSQQLSSEAKQDTGEE